jgi:hypothetical protein
MICAFFFFFFTKCRFQYVCQIAQQNDVLYQIFPFLVVYWQPIGTNKLVLLLKLMQNIS